MREYYLVRCDSRYLRLVILLWSKDQIRYCRVYGSALRKWVVTKGCEDVNEGGSPMIEACPPEAGHMRALAWQHLDFVRHL